MRTANAIDSLISLSRSEARNMRSVQMSLQMLFRSPMLRSITESNRTIVLKFHISRKRWRCGCVGTVRISQMWSWFRIGTVHWWWCGRVGTKGDDEVARWLRGNYFTCIEAYPYTARLLTTLVCIQKRGWGMNTYSLEEREGAKEGVPSHIPSPAHPDGCTRTLLHKVRMQALTRTQCIFIGCNLFHFICLIRSSSQRVPLEISSLYLVRMYHAN